MLVPNTSSTPENPCGAPKEQLPQHILPSAKPQHQMLLEQDTLPGREKSSCSLLCPPTAPLATGTIPSTESSCSPGRLKHGHGCTKELRAPQADQPAMAGHPRGKDEIIIHWKACCGSGFAPAWQSRCPACPREASSGSPDWAHQWRSWLKVALGSFLCNGQPKSQWFIPSNIWLQPTIILPHDGKCLFFPWNGVHCRANKKNPRAHKWGGFQLPNTLFPVSATTTKVRPVISPLEQNNTGVQSINHTVKFTVFQKQNWEFWPAVSY